MKWLDGICYLYDDDSHIQVEHQQTKPIDSKILTTGRGFSFLLYTNCYAKNVTYTITFIIEKAGEFQKASTSASLTMPKLCVDHNELWKILKEMRIPDHLTCLLRNLYAGQEVTVRTGHGTTNWFKIGKEVCQGCILSPCLFNLYAE